MVVRNHLCLNSHLLIKLQLFQSLIARGFAAIKMIKFKSNKTLMAVFQDPQFESGHVFHNGRLHGAVDVPRTLKDVNMDPREVSS